MGEAIVRAVRKSDAADLQKNIFFRNTLAEVEERIAGNIEQMKTGDFFHYVAEVDGVVAGNMAFERNAHPFSRHICSLGDVVVNAAFQRRGIARRLFETCREQARRSGMKLITVNVRGGTAAEEVYRKLGFIEAGRIPGGIIENYGDHAVFDDVTLYQTI